MMLMICRLVSESYIAGTEVGLTVKGTRWYKGSPGDIDRTLVDAIKLAIATGYRHLDAAEGTSRAFGNTANENSLRN